MTTSFGIIIIGDEILSGRRVDQHFSKVVQLLAARGLKLDWAEILGDDLAMLCFDGPKEQLDLTVTEIFKFIVQNLTSHYEVEATKIVGLDAIFVHMVNKYYKTGQATWADSTLLAKIIKRSNTLRLKLYN